MDEKGEGDYNGDVMHSIRNIVSNITICTVRDGYFIRYVNVESLCYTPEINVIPYVNNTLIKIKEDIYLLVLLFCRHNIAGSSLFFYIKMSVILLAIFIC